jgi:hypothetical protein
MKTYAEFTEERYRVDLETPAGGGGSKYSHEVDADSKWDAIKLAVDRHPRQSSHVHKVQAVSKAEKPKAAEKQPEKPKAPQYQPPSAPPAKKPSGVMGRIAQMLAQDAAKRARGR